MNTLKPIIGATMLVICIAILAIIGCFHFFGLKKPAFLRDNIVELTILTFVSLLMGLLLIIL